MHIQITIASLLLLCFTMHAMDDREKRSSIQQHDYQQVYDHENPPQPKRSCGDIVCSATTCGLLCGCSMALGSMLCTTYNPLYWWAVLIGGCCGCACGSCYVCVRDGGDAFCSDLIDVVDEKD